MRRFSIWALFLTLTVAHSRARAQDQPTNPAPSEKTADSNENAQEVLATEDDAEASPNDAGSTENAGPSLRDLPSERPSFLLFGFLAGEGVQSNPNGSSDHQGTIASTPRFEGNANLLKYWRHSVTALDYIGGGVFYSSGTQQIQQFIAAQRFERGKRRLTLSDSYGHSYGANFGSFAFGGGGLNNLLSGSNATNGLISPGSSLFLGGTNFSAVGSGPYLTNVARAVLTQSLSQRSSFTLSGSYGFTSYSGSGISLIDSRQFAFSANYERLLSVKAAIGLSYGYRDLSYPHNRTGSVFDQVAYFSYSRMLTERTRISAGAGPEFSNFTTRIQIPIVNPPIFLITTTHQTNASAFASVLHNLGRTSLDLSYERLITSGSGIVAGANSDLVHASAGRSVFKYWGASLDGGYSRLTQIGPSSQGAGLAYRYWYAGGAMRRVFLNGVGVFASYQHNQNSSNNLVCLLRRACGYGTNLALVGVSWQARPIRLDRGGNLNPTGSAGDNTSADQALDQTNDATGIANTDEP